MASEKPSLLVTGVAGNLGARLLPMLEGFHVIGVDFRPPAISSSLQFEQLDLGQESSCQRMAEVLQEFRAVGVVHLAFVLDPLKMGVLDRERMWRINVAGTARVLEAIAEVNRMGGRVKKLIHLSSVAVYGPNLKRAARENDPLNAHTLAYALHKKEADRAVQTRAKQLGGCEVYLLRPHIFAGDSVQNYMIDCIRGTAYGRGRIGKMLARRNKRLPMLFPVGRKYLDHKIQFVHVDDVARVIAWAISKPASGERLNILNVAGRGEPLTIEQCAQIAHAPLKRLPTAALCRKVIEWMWEAGASSIPPDAFPYLIGSYTMETSKLQDQLGREYERVIRYTSEAALAQSVMPALTEQSPEVEPAAIG